MSKRWTIEDDRFLARHHEVGADFIASHDLGFHSKGAGERRIAKLKAAGVWEKLIAERKAQEQAASAWMLAFGPAWAKEIAAEHMAEDAEAAA